jgi:hypothetical protein
LFLVLHGVAAHGQQIGVEAGEEPSLSVIASAGGRGERGRCDQSLGIRPADGAEERDAVGEDIVWLARSDACVGAAHDADALGVHVSQGLPVPLEPSCGHGGDGRTVGQPCLDGSDDRSCGGEPATVCRSGSMPVGVKNVPCSIPSTLRVRHPQCLGAVCVCGDGQSGVVCRCSGGREFGWSVL